MEMTDIEHAVRISAIAAGIIFGAGAISSASWVWVKKQIFAVGGGGLCIAGTILIGLSVYKSVDVGASFSGIHMKLSEIERQMQRTQQQITALASTASGETTMRLNSDLASLGNEIDKLGKTLLGIRTTSQILQTTGFTLKTIALKPQAAQLVQTANQYNAEGKLEDAATALGKAIASQIAAGTPGNTSGTTTSNTGQTTGSDLPASSDDLAQLYFSRAALWQRLGKFDQAAADYRKGAELLTTPKP